MICGLKVPLICLPDKALYLASPSLQWVALVTLPHLTGLQQLNHRYYVPLRPPFRHLGLLRFRSRPDTLLDFSSFCVLVRLQKKMLPDKLVAQVEIYLNFAQPFSSPIGCGFRYFSHKELTVLSSSQTTPMCTCPARSLRWCRQR